MTKQDEQFQESRDDKPYTLSKHENEIVKGGRLIPVFLDDVRYRLQNFLGLVHKRPTNVQVNKQANNSKYVPISTIEAKLDQLFFGLWETTNFKSQVIGNEIVGQIDLTVVHPTLGVKLTRTGTGAVQIRLKKDSAVTDLGNKIPNALVMDYPHLKAECIKNAAKSLGKAFGRDLNRDYFEDYTPFVKNNDDKSKQVVNDVKNGMGIKPANATADVDNDLFSE